MKVYAGAKSNRQLGLDELPVSSRTIMIDDRFMISDNLDASAAIDVLKFPDMSEVSLNTPFKIRFTMLLVCLSGSMRLRIHMEECTISRADMLITMEGAICECMDITPDARLFMIAFSGDFNILDAGIKPTPEILCGIMRRPLVRLDESELSYISSIYEMLRLRLSDPTFVARKEIAVSGLRLMFCFISGHLVPSGVECLKPVTRRQRLLDDFLNLVEMHSGSHRDLGFYADSLYISAKYLSRIVSETSGRSARDWITMRVILEAKLMLKESDLSVQEISDRLNFSNQSFFGTFFKRQVGISPSDYRNKA